ncbi:MAG: hypothetical protein H6R14_1000 [Proteobacteria bacterium]|nr:hypothetical protein [Pseudomonadota bacterium]
MLMRSFFSLRSLESASDTWPANRLYEDQCDDKCYYQKPNNVPVAGVGGDQEY